jgi:sulfide:quinone oxidoreductase
MSAHKHIADSGLADESGYLDINKFTMQHTKYPTGWGLGDCMNTPNSKTAAALFSQTEVLVKYKF